MIHLIVDLKAVPKARPRFTRSGHVYTSQATKVFESHLRSIAAKSIANPLSGAVHVGVVFNIKKAKSSKLERPTKRPDLDNLLKSVLDALNGVAYNDDSQILEIFTEKKFSENDSIEITVNEI